MFASNLIHINRRGIFFLTMLTLLLVPLLSKSNMSVRAAPAHTYVGGPVVSDTTWTLANSPYIVTENVDVSQGVTLTIQSGVVVKFNRDQLLQVDGTLIARGADLNPITFTSVQASPQKGDWKNIKFADSSVDATFDGAGNYTGGSILEYCVVEYGGNAVEGAVQIDNASPLIEHCAVRNNSSRGIRAVATSDSPIVIRNNTVSGNPSSGHGGGIYASYGTLTGNIVSNNSATASYYLNGGGIYAINSTVTDNTISGNSSDDRGGGICAESSTVSDNIVRDNTTTGLSGRGGGIYAKSSTVTGNTVSGNVAHSAYHRYGFGGGICALGGTVTGNIVTGNSTPDKNGWGGGIFVEGGTVTGNIVAGNSAFNDAGRGGGIYAGVGALVVGNTVSRNLTSGCGGGIAASGGMVVGNTVSGNSAAGGGGICATGGSSVVSNTIAANSISTDTGQGAGVYFRGSADFLYNTIVGNTVVSPTAITGGVVIDGAPQFHYNNLYDNANYDLVVISSGDISGTNNYWGAVVAADILTRVYDEYDDPALGRLLYVPYLQAPDPSAPLPPPRNLRAELTAGSAELFWDTIPSTTSGYSYKVYYDTDTVGPPYQGTGAAQGSSPIDVGNATQFTLSGWGNDIVYVTVTAYDTQGRESWYSNAVSSLGRTYLPVVLESSAVLVAE